MTRLYLITHAHTAADPATDARLWRLSPTGVDQAARLAAAPWWDDVDAIVLSSEAKTRLTVAPLLAQRDLPVVIDARFDELKRGGWCDDYAGQVQRMFAVPDTAVDGWECAASALARVRAGMADLHAHHPHGTLALVSHGLVLSIYRAHVLGLPRVRFTDWQQLSFAAVAVVAGAPPVLVQDFVPVVGHQPRG